MQGVSPCLTSLTAWRLGIVSNSFGDENLLNRWKKGGDMKNFFVVDFKKRKGAEDFKNVVVGHNARGRKAQRPNVDTARTPKNVELSPLRWRSHAEMMEELNEKARASGGRRLRKGSAEWFSIVVDCSVMPGWTEEDYVRYLRDAERFLRERFKGHPVLHSVIHMDEKKPHLHISFSYFNEEVGRWSQKKLYREKLTDLDKLLDDFGNDVGKRYGLRRGDKVTREALGILRDLRQNVEEAGLIRKRRVIPTRAFDKVWKSKILPLLTTSAGGQLSRALVRIEELEQALKDATEKAEKVAERERDTARERERQLRQELERERQKRREAERKLTEALGREKELKTLVRKLQKELGNLERNDPTRPREWGR